MITISFNLYSQESCNQLDSLGERHGFWSVEVELYCKNKDCSIVVSGEEKGTYFHGKKIGLWNILDNKGKLFKQEFYQNGECILSVRYRRNRILTIAIHETVKHSDNLIIYKAIDVTTFNRVGVVKKREYNSINGKIITEKY